MSRNPECRILEEQSIRRGRRILIEFTCAGELLRGILLLPPGPEAAPAALLLHGFALDKERMSELAGTALLAEGVASLALDLPLHGDRYEPIDLRSLGTPFSLLRRWRAAQEESALGIRLLGSRPEIDPTRLGLVGYSLGAYLGLKVAAGEPSIRGIVIAAAGDLPDYTPFASLVRTAADPLKLVRRLAGRQVLIVHGRNDTIIPPAHAERLFAAAAEPKEIRWWDSGHILPPAAIEDAAAWLAQRTRGQPVST